MNVYKVKKEMCAQLKASTSAKTNVKTTVKTNVKVKVPTKPKHTKTRGSSPTSNTTCVQNRLSTMRYEIAKSLNPPPRILPQHERELRASLLALDGSCEYCGRNAGNGVGDHFYAVMLDRYPSEYCNDAWNRINACVTCNSSKGNKTWRQWLTSKSPKNPLLNANAQTRTAVFAKFEKYDKYMQRYCQRKVIDKCFFDKQLLIIAQALTEVQMNLVNYQMEMVGLM